MKYFIKHVFALAAVAMLFTGCGKESPVDPGNGNGNGNGEDPGEEPTIENFDIKISDIFATSAKAYVTPSEEKDESYFTFRLFDEITYNEKIGGSPDEFVVFLEADIIAEAEWQGLKLPVYIDEFCNYGKATISMKSLEPSTKHIFCFAEVSTNGKVVGKPIISEFTTSDPSGNPPMLQLTLEPGDTDNVMEGKMFSDVAEVAKSIFLKAEDVALAISDGKTYRDIVDEQGMLIPSNFMADMNSDRGLRQIINNAEPNTEYCYIVKAYSVAGASIVENVVRKSAGGEEEDPIAEYTAWIGTWTVTSTSSEIKKQPISFDVTITPDVNNRTFNLTGWSISEMRLDPQYAVKAKFDYFRHDLSIRNMQDIQTLPGQGVVKYTARLWDIETKKYVVTDITDNALVGTMTSAGKSATVKGGLFWFMSGEMECTGIDMFMWADNGDIIAANPAAGFTSRDFPIGPYTMTKKAQSASTAPASYNNLTSPAFVMSAANKQNMVSAKPKAKKLTPLIVAGSEESKPNDNIEFTVLQ